MGRNTYVIQYLNRIGIKRGRHKRYASFGCVCGENWNPSGIQLRRLKRRIHVPAIRI